MCVMPAKASIQANSRNSGALVWIPAFAGMSASARTLCQHGASPCESLSQALYSKVTASPQGGVESNRRGTDSP